MVTLAAEDVQFEASLTVTMYGPPAGTFQLLVDWYGPPLKLYWYGGVPIKAVVFSTVVPPKQGIFPVLVVTDKPAFADSWIGSIRSFNAALAEFDALVFMNIV